MKLFLSSTSVVKKNKLCNFIQSLRHHAFLKKNFRKLDEPANNWQMTFFLFFVTCQKHGQQKTAHDKLNQTAYKTL